VIQLVHLFPKLCLLGMENSAKLNTASVQHHHIYST